MISWLDNDIYADKDPKSRLRAIDHIALALYRGEVALFLGAGVSRPLGLPGWPELVTECVKRAAVPGITVPPNPETKTLIELAGIVRRHIGDDAQYHGIVSDSLYATAKPRDLANASPLLLALGALMMGSRRGRVREVWTLNFDDILEWYLRINGFIAQVVTEVPTLLRETDVTVYHPHGFLPLDSLNGVRAPIVFDEESYADRSFGSDQAFLDATKNILCSKVILAVGMSWDDDIVKKLVIACRNTVKNRPLAFWMFGPDVTPSAKKNCLDFNVVPLEFACPKFTDYPPFLLQICEAAMRHARL